MWHRATTPSPRSRFQQMPRTTMLALLIPIQERRFPEGEISLENLSSHYFVGPENQQSVMHPTRSGPSSDAGTRHGFAFPLKAQVARALTTLADR